MTIRTKTMGLSMAMGLGLATLIASCWAPKTWARPVSYPGGWTAMQMNRADVSSLHLHYSPSSKISVGYYGELWRASDGQLHALQLNQLLKRWNAPKAQANLYWKTGLGLSQNHGRDLRPTAFSGVAADWETRRWFVAYDNRFYAQPSPAPHLVQRARVGFAPYVADYGALHTWLMLELEHVPTRPDESKLTGLVRVFKGTALAEVGVDEDGHALFNWIYRY